jgi:hypothetical protein
LIPTVKLPMNVMLLQTALKRKWALNGSSLGVLPLFFCLLSLI